MKWKDKRLYINKFESVSLIRLIKDKCGKIAMNVRGMLIINLKIANGICKTFIDQLYLRCTDYCSKKCFNLNNCKTEIKHELIPNNC